MCVVEFEAFMWLYEYDQWSTYTTINMRGYESSVWVVPLSTVSRGMITSANSSLQMVCQWNLAVWSPVSWAVSGAVRSVPCREGCRPTSMAQDSAAPNISRRLCTSAITTARASSILYSANKDWLETRLFDYNNVQVNKPLSWLVSQPNPPTPLSFSLIFS